MLALGGELGKNGSCERLSIGVGGGVGGIRVFLLTITEVCANLKALILIF
jgi:hypothetical protein